MFNDHATIHSSRWYHIVLCGTLDEGWLAVWSDEDLCLAQRKDGMETVLRGSFDQAGLRGILNRLWDLNLAIIAVCQEPKELKND